MKINIIILTSLLLLNSCGQWQPFTPADGSYYTDSSDPISLGQGKYFIKALFTEGIIKGANDFCSRAGLKASMIDFNPSGRGPDGKHKGAHATFSCY